MEQLNPETIADFFWAQFYIAILILEARRFFFNTFIYCFHILLSKNQNELWKRILCDISTLGNVHKNVLHMLFPQKEM